MQVGGPPAGDGGRAFDHVYASRTHAPPSLTGRDGSAPSSLPLRRRRRGAVRPWIRGRCRRVVERARSARKEVPSPALTCKDTSPPSSTALGSSRWRVHQMCTTGCRGRSTHASSGRLRRSVAVTLRSRTHARGQAGVGRASGQRGALSSPEDGGGSVRRLKPGLGCGALSLDKVAQPSTAGPSRHASTRGCGDGHVAVRAGQAPRVGLAR